MAVCRGKPWQKFCPEWNPAKGEEVRSLSEERKRDKILLGPWLFSPTETPVLPFPPGTLALTSPIQSPQVAEAIFSPKRSQHPSYVTAEMALNPEDSLISPPTLLKSPLFNSEILSCQRQILDFFPLLFRHKSF